MIQQVLVHYLTSKSAIYTNKTKRFSTICFTQKRSSGEGNYQKRNILYRMLLYKKIQRTPSNNIYNIYIYIYKLFESRTMTGDKEYMQFYKYFQIYNLNYYQDHSCWPLYVLGGARVRVLCRHSNVRSLR